MIYLTRFDKINSNVSKVTWVKTSKTHGATSSDGKQRVCSTDGIMSNLMNEVARGSKRTIHRCYSKGDIYHLKLGRVSWCASWLKSRTIKPGFREAQRRVTWLSWKTTLQGLQKSDRSESLMRRDVSCLLRHIEFFSYSDTLF